MDSVLATLEWESPTARHQDHLVLPLTALQADAGLARLAAGLTETQTILPIPDLDKWIKPRGQPPARLPAADFRLPVQPIPGRYYPRLAYAGLAAGPRDMRPGRLLSRQGTELLVDVNHPLAACAPHLGLGRCPDRAAPGRLQHLFEGPGLQVPAEAGRDCYLPPGALAREDEEEDRRFYAQPRLVHHLDAACRRRLVALQGSFLSTGMSVLDLMSSWVTHLPVPRPASVEITGLGMNPTELEANSLLARRLVHDLNAHPCLPFPDRSFDLALCSASVEYLVHPLDIARELHRVLRPGGVCLITFSDRWFSPKAIRVWSELHPFERQGLVLWLLSEAGFLDLHTFSLRGLERPADDRYASQRPSSDPLFAVWGLTRPDG